MDLLLDVPAASAGEAARIPWIALYKRPTSTCNQIVINLWDPKDLARPHPILGDVRVRRALDLAFPRERIVEEVLANLAYPAYTGFPPFSRFYHPEIAGPRLDPEKARRLLDEAGWTMGPDGYRYKEGKKLRLALFTTAGSEIRERVAALCREAWRAIGVDLAVVSLDLATFGAECLAKRGFDLAMFPWEAGIEPGPSSPWHSKQIPGEGGNGQNYGGYANREMDGLLAEMGKTEDGEKRKALCRRMQEILVEEVPSIFVNFYAQIAAMHEGFKNFRPNPASGTDFWNVYEWYRAW
ncbi:MAG: hypothetical protein K6U03_11210 [Firmicutes bacterium]|nr:hypothetical protein [Bacillota bacterium]